jgi:hypothetical protein
MRSEGGGGRRAWGICCVWAYLVELCGLVTLSLRYLGFARGHGRTIKISGFQQDTVESRGLKSRFFSSKARLVHLFYTRTGSTFERPTRFAITMVVRTIGGRGCAHSLRYELRNPSENRKTLSDVLFKRADVHVLPCACEILHGFSRQFPLHYGIFSTFGWKFWDAVTFSCARSNFNTNLLSCTPIDPQSMATSVFGFLLLGIWLLSLAEIKQN